MNTLVTRTKIILPRRSANLLTRERLLDLLYDLLDYRLILVVGPAGYGKTSLLVDMAHHIEMPVCWYSLDLLDRDIQGFLAHFIACVAQRFPDFGKQSSAALQSTTSTDFDIGWLVRIIVNDAYEHIREHFVFVLDDYHMVSDSEIINCFISQFVQKMDENCHLFLSSRRLPNLPDLPLMVARSQVGGLEFKELAFRADEIQALMLQNYHLAIPASEAEQLAQATEGWITGLLLSAQTMWHGMADQVRLARISGVGLYDYLAQQVLDQQSAPVRDFLLRTSFMEEFDTELCKAVLGSGDWSHFLDIILRSNLFVLPVDDGGVWLRYHHLFRDFLQARLAQECPEERNRILRRLAAVYAEREEWEKAYDILQRLGDMAATANLIEQAGSSLVKSGRWTILAGCIDALPADVLASCAGLLSLRGFVAVELGEAERGLSLLNQAEAAFRAASDLPCLARTLVRRAADHRLLGNYQASLADAEEALSLAEGDELLRTVWAEALRAKGMSLFMMGQLNEAVRWLTQSLSAYATLEDKQNTAMLSMELGLAYRRAGSCNQALTHYNHALDYWRKNGDIFRQANLLNNLGVLYHFKGDYERAGLHLEDALDCARRSGYARIEALALCSIGDLYADLGASDSALDAYRQAREIAQRIEYRFLLLCLDVAEAAQSRTQGNTTQARVLLESARQLAQKSGSGFEQGLWQLESGRLALAEGNVPEATAHLEGAARRFDEGNQKAEAASACFHLATACHMSKDKKAAMAHLEHAFHLASGLESQHVLVMAGRDARPLLEFAQNNLDISSQVSRLLQQIAQFERDVPVLRRCLRQRAPVVSFVLPRLSFLALGNAQVMADGKPVTSVEWQAQVARDLLFCLLAHPEGLAKEAVGAIFWPECTLAQLKVRFKKTIYRLRRALGQDVVLFDQDRYTFNRTLDYEHDVETFEGKLAQAQATTDLDERAKAYGAAIDLYTGPYLPNIDGNWVVPERERLWQVCLKAILELVELHLKANRYEAALNDCQRALAQDSCLEEMHCLAMRAYAAMGNRVAVVRQFERCRQSLHEELVASISPQTRLLYEKLVGRDHSG